MIRRPKRSARPWLAIQLLASFQLPSVGVLTAVVVTCPLQWSAAYPSVLLRSFRKRTIGVVVYPLREILARDVCF
jgi:hypothetical protein